MVIIATDSAADFELHELREKNIVCLPMSVTFGSQVLLENVDLTKEEFFERIETDPDFPRTSQPSPAMFEELFEQAREKGDEIVYIPACLPLLFCAYLKKAAEAPYLSFDSTGAFAAFPGPEHLSRPFLIVFLRAAGIFCSRIIMAALFPKTPDSSCFPLMAITKDPSALFKKTSPSSNLPSSHAFFDDT